MACIPGPQDTNNILHHKMHGNSLNYEKQNAENHRNSKASLFTCKQLHNSITDKMQNSKLWVVFKNQFLTLQVIAGHFIYSTDSDILFSKIPY